MEDMWFIVSVWRNARLTGGTLTVWIDGRQCTSVDEFHGLHADGPQFNVLVPTEAKEPGCGYPGARMEFRIDGTPIREVVQWERGYHSGVQVNLGLAFARYLGSFTYDVPEWPHWIEVEPRINGVVCGEDRNVYSSTIFNDYQYWTFVYSEEMTPGCGKPGAMIDLYAMLVTRDDRQRTEIGWLTRVEWQPGDYIVVPRVTLTAPLPTP